MIELCFEIEIQSCTGAETKGRACHVLIEFHLLFYIFFGEKKSSSFCQKESIAELLEMQLRKPWNQMHVTDEAFALQFRNELHHR